MHLNDQQCNCMTTTACQKEKTTLWSVIQEKLMVNLRFPFGLSHLKGGWGGGGGRKGQGGTACHQHPALHSAALHPHRNILATHAIQQQTDGAG